MKEDELKVKADYEEKLEELKAEYVGKMKDIVGEMTTGPAINVCRT